MPPRVRPVRDLRGARSQVPAHGQLGTPVRQPWAGAVACRELVGRGSHPGVQRWQQAAEGRAGEGSGRRPGGRAACRACCAGWRRWARRARWTMLLMLCVTFGDIIGGHHGLGGLFEEPSSQSNSSRGRRTVARAAWARGRTPRAARGGRRQPTAPSIWSSISRLSSRAYSIGSSRAMGSTKPRTMVAAASSSVMPRLMR
jgi:hypothetical protein